MEIYNPFSLPDNRHNFELFLDFLTQSPRGLALCQTAQEEQREILEFFDRHPLRDNIYLIDMIHPLRGTMELQQSIIDAVNKRRDKRHIFFIYNIEVSTYLSKSKPKDFFRKLNLMRDFFMRFDAAFVFFFMESSLKKLIQNAFDFYDWVKFMFIFIPEVVKRPVHFIEPRRLEIERLSDPTGKIEYLTNLLEKVEIAKEKGKILNELASLYVQIRDFEAAKQHLREALKISQTLNDRPAAAHAHYRLGSVAFAVHDLEEAGRNYRKALKIFTTLNNRAGAATIYLQLGNVDFEGSDFKAAQQNYREALNIFQALTDVSSLWDIYHQLGNVAFVMGDSEEARQNFLKALNILQELNDRYNQAGIYHQLGVLAFDIGDIETAQRYYREALTIFQEFNDLYSQALTYRQLANLAEKEKDYLGALKYFATALGIFIEYKDNDGQKILFEDISGLMREWDTAEEIETLKTTEEVKTILRRIRAEVRKNNGG